MFKGFPVKNTDIVKIKGWKFGRLMGVGAIATLLPFIAAMPGFATLPEVSKVQSRLTNVQLAQAIEPSRQGVGKTALVIGNGNYVRGKLANPVNDAKDIRRALESYGFEVIQISDSNRQEMNDAIELFNQKLASKGGVGLFYYAGHGVQIGGANYLVPINVKGDSEKELRSASIRLAEVIDRMNRAKNLSNIIILDACRDNPFGLLSQTKLQNFSNSAPRKKPGLAPEKEAAGMLIAFSTDPNNTAADGIGRNSPFTTALLEAMKDSRLSVQLMFEKVREMVRIKTDYKQSPSYVSSLGRIMYISDIYPRWEKRDPQNEYRDLSSNSFEIVAAPNTTLQTGTNTEGQRLYLATGNYEAVVKVRFSSNINYQRATLGVRAVGEGGGIMRISMLERQRVESAFYPENSNIPPNNLQQLPSDAAFLRIRKEGLVLTSSYSLDGKSNWKTLLQRPMPQDLSEMEVFLSVISTHQQEKASAEFSDIQITSIAADERLEVDALVSTLRDIDLKKRYVAVDKLTRLKSTYALDAIKAKEKEITQILDEAYKAEIIELDRGTFPFRPVICKRYSIPLICR